MRTTNASTNEKTNDIWHSGQHSRHTSSPIRVILSFPCFHFHYASADVPGATEKTLESGEWPIICSQLKHSHWFTDSPVPRSYTVIQQQQPVPGPKVHRNWLDCRSNISPINTFDTEWVSEANKTQGWSDSRYSVLIGCCLFKFNSR